MITNTTFKAADLTEASINEMLDRLKQICSQPIAVHPTRFVVPPWVVEEIVREYGEPATVEKYHRWNARRLGLTDEAYAAQVLA